MAIIDDLHTLRSQGMFIEYQPPRDCAPVKCRGCLYASLPYFEGEWTITGNDGNPWSLRGNGALPECFKVLPVIRFDKSSNEALRLWFMGVMDTIPSEHVNLARGCGLVVDEPATAMTTQDQVRDAFWEAHPNLTYKGKSVRQDAYPTDTRVAFVDYVDSLQKSGQISDKLAGRIIL